LHILVVQINKELHFITRTNFYKIKCTPAKTARSFKVVYALWIP